jgi:DNA polymerase (family 10)
MISTNANVADLLRRYAAALALQRADRFKIKAYRRAAETIEGLTDDVGELIRSGGDLCTLPGIGDAISQIILEIVKNGKLDRLETTISKLTPELAELAAYPRLDAAKVTRIYKKLGIKSVAELGQRLAAGEIREQLGSRMEFHVRQGLADRPRHLHWSVREFSSKFEAYLRGLPAVSQAVATGSLRRKVETVGDLNFLVSGQSAAAVFRDIGSFGAIKSIEKLTTTERRYDLSSGLAATVRWTPEEHWGLALLQATGSHAHLKELETWLKPKNLSLSPAALRRRKIKMEAEEDLYAGFELQFIDPELREGNGEVASAAANQLPKLVAEADIRGDLHMHTTASDGANSVEEMAHAARERGYEYIAISDHSQSLKITNGLTEKRLLQHIRAIDRLNKKLRGFRILKSAEVDILEDGKLDYSNAVLKHLDFTICSIHSRFNLSREQQTARVLRAMDNPYFTILGHATGRLLLRREGYDIDMERVLKHARDIGCFFEINSSPDRLDLSADHARAALGLGIKIAINTDAHSIRELRFMTAGIQQARRAWLTADDVLNTRHLNQLLKILRRD